MTFEQTTLESISPQSACIKATAFYEKDSYVDVFQGSDCFI